MGADGTKVLVPKVESDTKYLYYALNAAEIPAAGYSRHYKYLKEIQVPLPPLAEQKRITGILDAADSLRAKRREALAQLDTLLQSTFLDMFGDPVTNPMGWKVARVGDATQMGTGSTPSRKHKNYFDGSIPWVKSTEVNWGTVTATSESVSADGVKAARPQTVPQGKHRPGLCTGKEKPGASVRFLESMQRSIRLAVR